MPCLRGNSTTGAACVVGMFNTKNVTYPDPYDPAYTVWFQARYLYDDGSSEYDDLFKAFVYMTAVFKG